MKVIILPRTRLEFEKTAIYIKEYFGVKSSKKFRTQFFQAIKMISDNPNIAPKEELLMDEPLNFRGCVINHINKIIYYTQNNTIYIADLWDMRQCPDNLKNRI